VAVTYEDDLSTDLVVAECERQGTVVFRFNTETFPIQAQLHFDPAAPTGATLITSTDTVAVGAARGIWIRRPQWPVISDIVSDPVDRDLARREAIAALGGLWRTLARRCVSPPDALQAARWKVHQLWLAKGMGARVPETAITNDPIHAREFVLAHPDVVIKAVQDARAGAGGVERAGLTEVLHQLDSADLKVTPVMLQERVAKIADVRITAIGTQLFAVRIRTPVGAALDFRAAEPADCQYEVVDLDPPIIGFCVDFLNAYGLRYGAFDFAEDANGGMWFLECNPSGQWGWLEAATGLPFSRSLVELLLSLSR
jgi:hypothetical protein